MSSKTKDGKTHTLVTCANSIYKNLGKQICKKMNRARALTLNRQRTTWTPMI